MHRTLLLLLLALLIVTPGAPAAGQTAEPALTSRLFLPALASGPGPRTIFGVEVTRLDQSRGLDALTALNPSWVRRNGLRWEHVEPIEGKGYRWDSPAVKALEAEMSRASSLGLNLILVIRGSPAWATAPSSADCAPIRADKRAAFARFLGAVVARYSAQPYGVRHWEIGNEPDAPLFANDSGYGCWGDPADPYYGGRAYGELLKVAYPAIKAADPRAQVLNGGLLLDKPYDPASGAGRSGRFLEGVLEAGAGGSFDILSYHSYTFHNGNPDGTTGATDWKPVYLRDQLRRYGLSKPLLNTEAALLCIEVTAACTRDQAYAVPRIYARAMRDQLLGLVWYIFDSDGFRNTALVEPASPSTPRPAHLAYDQASSALGGMSYVGEVAGLPAGVEGHRFASGRSVTLLLWANTPQRAVVSIGAAGGLSCREWDGAALPCAAAGGSLAIEARPGARYISYTTP